MYYRTAFHAIVDTDIDPWEDTATLTDTPGCNNRVFTHGVATPDMSGNEVR
jgi:hypothetical protein